MIFVLSKTVPRDNDCPDGSTIYRYCSFGKP